MLFCFARTQPIPLLRGSCLVRRFLPRPAPSEILPKHQGGGSNVLTFCRDSCVLPATIAYPVSCGPFFVSIPLYHSDQRSYFIKYKSTHLYVELLHLCDRLVDGVVVALVGDVVPSSRPCWLHITREGLLDRAATLVLLKSRTHSFVGLCLSHARNSPLDPCPLGLKMGCS